MFNYICASLENQRLQIYSNLFQQFLQFQNKIIFGLADMNQGGLACIMYNVGVQSMYKGIGLDAGCLLYTSPSPRD